MTSIRLPMIRITVSIVGVSFTHIPLNKSFRFPFNNLNVLLNCSGVSLLSFRFSKSKKIGAFNCLIKSKLPVFIVVAVLSLISHPPGRRLPIPFGLNGITGFQFHIYIIFLHSLKATFNSA